VPGGYNPDTWIQGVGPGEDGWVNGTSYYRIQSWKLKKDWSIEITAQTVTPSMYDLDYGPKPKSVPVPGLKVLFYPQSQGQWQPHYVQASSTDALFPNEWDMDVAESYTTNADGSANASLVVSAVLPVNQFLNGCGAPTITSASATVSTTGGTIPGGSLVRAAVVATGTTAGTCSPPSNIILIQIPTGTNTNKFTLNNIIWPAYQNLNGYMLFASTVDDLMCEQVSGSLTAGTPNTTYTPNTITCTAIARTGYELPNPNIANVVVKGKLGRHFGVAGFSINSVGTNTITTPGAIDTTGHDNWTGRIIAIIGRPDASIPFLSYTCTAFDPFSGQFTLNNSVAGVIDVGDVATICFQGYNNSSNPTVFTDAALVNAINTAEGYTTGLTANAEVGNIFRVIAGKSRGTTANIISNTGTSVTLDAQVLLDATSVVIIEYPSWIFSSPSTAVANSNLYTTAQLTLPVSNMVHQPVVIAGFTQDVNGVLSPDDGNQPIRLGWISGNEGTIYAQTPVANWQTALNELPQGGNYPS
jgi:hypothetical protein